MAIAWTASPIPIFSMRAKTLRIFDACSASVLALWLGTALSLPLGGHTGSPVLSILMAVGVPPLIHWLRIKPSNRVPALWAFMALWPGFMLSYFLLARPPSVSEIDLCAWFGFGLPMLLSWLPRWLHEMSDVDVIGPLRLWAAAGAAALTICLASQFIATPKIAELKAQMSQESISADQKDAMSARLKKAESISAQFLWIRAALAAGLMFGLLKLPLEKKATCETSSPKS